MTFSFFKLCTSHFAEHKEGEALADLSTFLEISGNVLISGSAQISHRPGGGGGLWVGYGEADQKAGQPLHRVLTAYPVLMYGDSNRAETSGPRPTKG